VASRPTNLKVKKKGGGNRFTKLGDTWPVFCPMLVCKMDAAVIFLSSS
jgi:hypothetical protein